MNFVVLFEDDSAAGPDVRRQHMPAHLAFLEKHSGKVRAAGPLRTSDGHGAGGLWVVDTADPSEVEALVKRDPF